MSYSLNEVEATARKAARGAGYSWGLAEEAGKAARWLCSQGIDGCAALAGLLYLLGEIDQELATPQIAGGVWDAADGILCPIATGAALADRSHALAPQEIRIGRIAAPILLVPFAAQAAASLGWVVSVACPSAAATTDGNQLCLEGRFEEVAGMMSVKLDGHIDHPKQRYTRAVPDAESWTALLDYAALTYAPATEASRLKGAGAGQSDND